MSTRRNFKRILGHGNKNKPGTYHSSKIHASRKQTASAKDRSSLVDGVLAYSLERLPF